ncbi:XTP/dITP diphosphatase [Aquibacillus sp. 3ASR75-54]|uniref:dITP/XTP pyrophosphatase n=2 Tax=Aquibacillus salsiterrae TaxID=2950439 RepID=A0A9X3WEQ6_9BACI|nr:XTP/dITP diphosphatase [Aquibacillus salsiterrae]MDC3415696.1 XTP/dITP diphosphatase [Aquibacillus salsiterrae]
MKKLLIATKNKGKVNDFNQLFSKYGIEILSLLDFKEEVEDIEETGTTFFENARIKAETVMKKYHLPVLADDSGLVVDALNGEPGVFSARYAGEEKNDLANVHKVLQRLQGVPKKDRTARFVCVLAVAQPNQPTMYNKGTCEGEILEVPRGENGFGYDPIFLPRGFKRSMAELSLVEKNEISHRKFAMDQLEQWLTSK